MESPCYFDDEFNYFDQRMEFSKNRFSFTVSLSFFMATSLDAEIFVSIVDMLYIFLENQKLYTIHEYSINSYVYIS
jgi:hypothetical protein